MGRSRPGHDRAQASLPSREISCWRPSNNGVSLARIGFSARQRPNKPRALRGIVEDGRRPLCSRIPQRPLVRSAAQSAQAGRQGQTSRPASDNGPILRRPATGAASRPRRRPAAGRKRRLDSARRADGRHVSRKSSRRGWRPGDRGFRPQSRDSLSRRALARKTVSRGAAPAHQQRQRLSQPFQTMAQTVQRRRPPKTCPTISAGAEP